MRHAFVPQRALAVVAPIASGRLEPLRSLLDQVVEDDVETGSMFPFGKLTRVHFGRFVIVERSLQADDTMRAVGPWLVLSTNHDGSLEEHLDELLAVAGAQLDRVFGHCVGWPSGGSPSEARRYLREHARPYGAFYVACPGLAVGQIKDEAALREEIGRFLDAHPALRAQTKGKPAELREALKAHLAKGPFAWALEPAGKPPLIAYTMLRWYGWRSLVALLLRLIVAVVLFPLTLFSLYHLRRLEKSDPQLERLDYDLDSIELADTEDKIVQNQMSILVDVKSGPFRRLVLGAVLNVIDAAARFIYVRGKLGSIPSIHFARWVLLDQGRALLFFSNYTGTWENYLGDFIDKASVGLTMVWSNTVLFPRTRWLVKEGARDERRFKVWARRQQMRTDVWYSAYKNLSSSNIQNNREIRAGLSGRMNPQELARWAYRL